MQQKERASNVPLYFDAMEAAVCKGLREWSGLSESNRHLNLGKVPYYHYTKAAQRPSFYSMPQGQRQARAASGGQCPRAEKQKTDQETLVTRAVFTTADRRCCSAKRVALSFAVSTR